jgi:ABC-type multidrug transport system fused ATPase/permease subunit
MQKNSFTAMVKRFFSPLKGHPRFLRGNVIVSCIYACFEILSVEIFKYATNSIQNGNLEGIKQIIIIFFGLFLGYLLFSRCFKNIGRVTMNYESKKYLHNIYLQKFFKLDNTKVEKLGTGKMQSILDNGFNTWKSMFSEVTSRIPQLFIP